MDDREGRARFRPETWAALQDLGWSPKRRISREVDDWFALLAAKGGFVPFEAARAALEEFGGLRSDVTADGVTVAREPFDFDPTLAAFDGKTFADAAGVIGQRLYPLGEGGGGHYMIAIAEDGALFYLGPWIMLGGRTIDEGIANLIEGRTGSRIGPDVG